jgi:hypothetical protein
MSVFEYQWRRSSQTITIDSREGPNRPQLVIWTKPAPTLSAMPLSLRR